MIIDIHTHVGEYKKHWSEMFAKIVSGAFAFDPNHWTTEPDKFTREMDEAGVDKIVVVALDITNIDPGTKIPDEYIYDNYIKRDPNRFMGFSCVLPKDSMGRFSPESLKQFERAITELGFKGMKALPSYSHYPPNDKIMYPFYQKAVELGVPVLLHMGATSYSYAKLEYGHPVYLDEVALDFPDLKICAAHTAYPWTKELFAVMRKCHNVYTDISALCMRPMELAWNIVLAKEYNLLERIMWGTDYPACNPKTYINWVKTGLNEILEKCGWPTLTMEEIKQILGANASRFLGLKN